MRTKIPHTFALAALAALGIVGCNGSEDNSPVLIPGAGGSGTVGAGGAVIGTVGGAVAVGGNTVGVTAVTGVSTGGTSATSSTGGSVSTGGIASTGGAATGGTTAKGGTSSTGGTTAKGGTTTKGGTSSTGGTTAKGGTSSTGGTTAKGGTSSTGGTTAKGGTSSTGGSVSTCSEANSEVCASNNTNKVGKHCGLTYEIWTDSSNSCMTNTSYGFKANWTTANGNYLARKGVRPGSTSPVVTYSANYQPNGNSYLAIYGWTQNPLIEYYIVDSWGSWRPPGTTSMGTVTVDGGTYDIYKSERVQQPSIEGTKTFFQYWSVRKEKRTSGTITVGPHFEAWKKYGLTMGTFYEVSLVIEGYNSSGNADVTVSFK